MRRELCKIWPYTVHPRGEVAYDNWKKRDFLPMPTKSVQTGTKGKGWVGHGPLHQTVSKFLTVWKSGDRKETEFTSLINLFGTGSEVVQILQCSRHIGALIGSLETVLSYDDEEVIPTEDVNNGRIEVEVLERENWGTEGSISEKREEMKV